MRYFARICAHARSWREFAKCRFAHFPSFSPSMLTPMLLRFVGWWRMAIQMQRRDYQVKADSGSHYSQEEITCGNVVPTFLSIVMSLLKCNSRGIFSSEGVQTICHWHFSTTKHMATATL